LVGVRLLGAPVLFSLPFSLILFRVPQPPDVPYIQSISGHKSLSALQRYVDVTKKDKEMAIAPGQGQLIKELLY